MISNIIPEISYPTRISYLVIGILIFYLISNLISYLIVSDLMSYRMDWFHRWRRKLQPAGIISSSEAISSLKAYATKHFLNASARAINDLINKDVPKSPAFNANDVDTDMLQRVQASIDSGDIQIINMNVESDGKQVLDSNLELFRSPAEKVLRELMADMRLAGIQHFAFQEYKDPRGNRLFAGHSIQETRMIQYLFN
jgi:hypothetical protein